MPFPRNSLRAFLQYAKRNLAQAANSNFKVNIVIGNESADLDSLTSSLLYAYTRSIAPPPNAFSPLYIPLLNILESGLRLRPEFTAVCHHANISPSQLLTLNDLPSQFGQPENIRWILVDHNKLQGALGDQYSGQVNGVIDHHDEENVVSQNTGREPRIVEKCGSCTSLVVRYVKSTWDDISSTSLSSGAAHAQGEAAIDDSVVAQGWDAQVAQMALASVLVDTANLTAPGKVQEVDREAVEYLEAKIQISAKDAKGWSRDDFYKELDEAKRDIGGLTLHEILMKDYKQWTENNMNLGISSVVKPISFLVDKAEDTAFETELERYMKGNKLQIFAIMTTSTNAEGKFQRELLVFAHDCAACYTDKFTERATPELGLEESGIEGVNVSTSGSDGWLKTWRQTDLSKSRKQVAPLLREAMRDHV